MTILMFANSSRHEILPEEQDIKHPKIPHRQPLLNHKMEGMINVSIYTSSIGNGPGSIWPVSQSLRMAFVLRGPLGFM